MEMQAKIKYLKKKESTYCHKGQVLAQEGQDMEDVKLISTLNTPHIEETEKKNQEDETMKKPIKIRGQTKFMYGMDKQTITHTAEKL
jgi:hypothetical protein